MVMSPTPPAIDSNGGSSIGPPGMIFVFEQEPLDTPPPVDIILDDLPEDEFQEPEFQMPNFEIPLAETVGHAPDAVEEIHLDDDDDDQEEGEIESDEKLLPAMLPTEALARHAESHWLPGSSFAARNPDVAHLLETAEGRREVVQRVIQGGTQEVQGVDVAAGVHDNDGQEVGDDQNIGIDNEDAITSTVIASVEVEENVELQVVEEAEGEEEALPEDPNAGNSRWRCIVSVSSHMSQNCKTKIMF